MVFPAPVLSSWQVRRRLEGIWEGSYSSGISLVNSFSFTGLVRCPRGIVFGLIFFNNKEDWIIPCNVKVSLLSSVNVKYN